MKPNPPYPVFGRRRAGRKATHAWVRGRTRPLIFWQEAIMEQAGGTWRMSAAMTLSGTIGLFVLGSGQGALTVVLFRCLIGGALLLAYLQWQGQWKSFDRPALVWLVAGGAALVVNWLCLFTAYRLSSISVATIVYH